MSFAIYKNLSNCYRHKNNKSISRIFKSYFWRIFAIWHNCGAALCEAQKNAHQTNFRQGTMHTGKMCLTDQSNEMYSRITNRGVAFTKEIEQNLPQGISTLTPGI